MEKSRLRKLLEGMAGEPGIDRSQGDQERSDELEGQKMMRDSEYDEAKREEDMKKLALLRIMQKRN